MKKIIVGITALLLILLCCIAYADDIRTSGLYTYTIKGNGTITIARFDWSNWNDGDSIFIPTMIDGYIVTAIGDRAFQRSDVKYITSSLRRSALQKEYITTDITLPDTVKVIGEKAFWNATLSSINIPDSIQEIGYGAFVGNPTITFKISPSQPTFAVVDDTLYHKERKELLAYPHYDHNNGSLGSISIPNGILSIGDFAFCRTESDISRIHIDIPNSVTNIGNHAFEGAKISIRLEKNGIIDMIPDSVTRIGESAFENTSWDMYPTGAGTLIIPVSVATIGQKAFKNAKICDEITILIKKDSLLQSVEKETFHFSEEARYIEHGFKIVIESDNIQSIGDYAFSGVEIYLSDTKRLTYIGKNAFSKGEVIFPSSIDTIPTGFNVYCSIPDNVRRINENAFEKVAKDYYLPSTIIYIADNAFPKDSSFVVESGSYAELWAKENGFQYTINGQNNLDWLNN